MRGIEDGPAVLSRCAVILAMVGCTPEDVVIGPPPPVPEKGSFGACTAKPAALAHLSGVLLQPFAIDEWSLYVVTSGETDGAAAQTLLRVPKDGSAPRRLATTETEITGLFVLADFVEDHVFWTTKGAPTDGGDGTGTVSSIGSAADATDEPVVVASNLPGPQAVIATDLNTLYWAESADVSGHAAEVLVRASTDGGPVTTIQTLDANDVPYDMLSWGGVAPLFWTTANPALGNESTAEIIEQPLLSPSEPLVRVTGPDAGGGGALAYDFGSGAFLYSGPNGIRAVPVDVHGTLGAPQTVVVTDGFVGHIEDDTNQVYFVDPQSRRLVAATRLPDTTAPRTLASGVDPATPFKIDGECIYWIDAPSATIMMVKK